MTRRVTLEELVQLVDGDRELVTILLSEQRISAKEGGFGAREVDCVLATRTLLRELEVNWPGADIVLRLREQLAIARKRIAELERQLER